MQLFSDEERLEFMKVKTKQSRQEFLEMCDFWEDEMDEIVESIKFSKKKIEQPNILL